MKFTCNENYGLFGNPTVKCNRCRDKIIGTLPNCLPLLVSTTQTIKGLTVTVENITNNAAFIIESTTASVDSPQRSTKSESNREELSMKNLSLIVISLVLIIIIVGMITFIWIRRCKMESLCWKKQPEVNSPRVISEYDDTYDYPMM